MIEACTRGATETIISMSFFLLFYCDFLCMLYFLHLITWLKTRIVQMEILNYKNYELCIKLTFAAIQKNQKPNIVKEYGALR